MVPQEEAESEKMSDRNSATGNPAKEAIRAQIDENLKRVYQSALEESVPDRFKQLLEQLKAKEMEK